MSDVRLLVGVVGAGTMGAGIAHVAAAAGHSVVLYDVSEGPLESGLGRMDALMHRAVARAQLESSEALATRARVTGTIQLERLARCGLVIEAAPESLGLKRRLFADLEAIVRPDALLATNTSTLSLAAVFGALRRPERGLGMHFFNPAPLMRLVEIVRGPTTSPEVIDRAVALARAWGKEPVTVAGTPGFLVNRVAIAYYGEAVRLLAEGVADVRAVDRLARDAGFPMGPFELADLVGTDVSLAAARSVFEGYFGEPRFRPHPIQQAVVDSGRLGRRAGRGYYDYDARPDDATRVEHC